MTKTILKWAGNKSKVMDKIGKLFPNEYERYLEPFAGSLGAFLNSGVECKALMNDLNKEIFNLFECVLEDHERVSKLANTIEKSKENYYKVRNLDRDSNWSSTTNRFEKAARIVYLNKMCFNGLYRINKSGQSNVGRFGWKEQEELIEECKRLKSLGCKVVVSNSYCDETLELYKDFDIHIIEAPRYISCKKDGRKPVKEIVAILT